MGRTRIVVNEWKLALGRWSGGKKGSKSRARAKKIRVEKTEALFSAGDAAIGGFGAG
jgi:hypothetical protein